MEQIELSINGQNDKYRVEVKFAKPLCNSVSEISGVAQNIEVARDLGEMLYKNANGMGGRGHVLISCNIATPPSFDWQVVEEYFLYTHGGAREGAGRKSNNPKRAMVTMRVTDEVKEKVDELKNKGVVLSDLFSEAVEKRYCDLK